MMIEDVDTLHSDEWLRVSTAHYRKQYRSESGDDDEMDDGTTDDCVGGTDSTTRLDGE